MVDFSLVVDKCQNSNIGRLLPNALYVHKTALASLDPTIKEYEHSAREIILQNYRQRQGEDSQLPELLEDFTLVKFSLDRPHISYLFYEGFDCDPHPKLSQSIFLNLITRRVTQRKYRRTENLPLLHRKETFVSNSYPAYKQFAVLTQEEEKLGLLANPRLIGHQQQWHHLLKQKRLAIVNHHLVCPISPKVKQPELKVSDRTKLAWQRQELSNPVQLAIETRILNPDHSFFDYGCGYGEDVRELAARGYTSSGWDPHHAADEPLVAADVVNFGYVLDAIKNLPGKKEALLKAWELTNKVLIVSSKILVENRQKDLVTYREGNTSECSPEQKYYEQEELKIYIDSILGADAIPAALGVYFVFKNHHEAENFVAARYVSQLEIPKINAFDEQFLAHQELLFPLMHFYFRRGRLPVKGELPEEAAIKEAFKTYHRAFKQIIRATDREQWDFIAEKRRQDLIVYLALANFKGRPSIRKIAKEIKTDAKVLLEGYRQACTVADMLLTGVRDLKKVAYLCRQSPIGKQLSGAIAIHISALDKLPPLLRVYEGCASRVFGRLPKVNIVKLYYDCPKISYLYYPDFDKVAHPTLQTTIEVNLSNYGIRYNDLSDHPNPLVLHHKDALVTPNYERYWDFKQLMNLEDKLGLLSDHTQIARQQQWQQHLDKHHLEIKDHTISCVVSG